MPAPSSIASLMLPCRRPRGAMSTRQIRAGSASLRLVEGRAYRDQRKRGELHAADARRSVRTHMRGQNTATGLPV